MCTTCTSGTSPPVPPSSPPTSWSSPVSSSAARRTPCSTPSAAASPSTSTLRIPRSSSSPRGTSNMRSMLITRSASSTIEDYLKTIYSHTEWQDVPITGSQLAARLGVVPSTVTEMVKKLASLGLVTHAPYGAITLTDAGRTEALRMVRRHRLVETWLVEGFGYSWDEVHDEAEVLEHALSDRLLDALDVLLGRPRRDPHGAPIADPTRHVVPPPATLASV